MRHLKSGSKLGRNPWHRRATLRNLVTNLFEHGRITTTLTRAKATRPVAEKIITLGKRDTLAARRQVKVVLAENGRSASGQVVWRGHEAWEVGIAFDHPDASFWGIKI